MKKNAILIFFLCAVMTTQAQLNVQSDGKVYIQRDSISGSSSLSVGVLPADSLRDYDSWRMGIRSYAYNSSQTGNCIGVFGEADHQYNTERKFSAGVWGMGGGAYSGMNFGVLGSKHTGEQGAGIYGTNQDDSYWRIVGDFAGYFYGPVHTEGMIYSTQGFYSLSDMRLKDNVALVSDTETTRGGTLNSLLGLNVIEYNLKSTLQEDIDAANGKIPSKANSLSNHTAENHHFGLSAQELQNIYPDLVVEREDGYLAVNYVELVPILIRSIQELKAELDEVKGSGSGNVMKARQHGTFDGEQTSGVGMQVASSGNVLFQNTPNPFTERTEIRFTLSDDARNAYIYIFDMTGKTLKQIPVDASMQSVTVNGYELSSGIYLYSLVVNGQEIDTKRMILSK